MYFEDCIKESAPIGGAYLIIIIISILEKKWSIFFSGIVLTSLFFIVLPLISYIIRLKYIAIIYKFLFKYIFILVASFMMLSTLSVSKNTSIVFETALSLLYIYMSLKYLDNLISFDDFEFADYINCREYFKVTTAKTIPTTTYSPPKRSATTKKTSVKKTSHKSSSTMVCVNCGKKVKNQESNICPYCGKDISKKANFKTCPTCALEYDSSSTHCPYCGAENK